MSRNYFQNVSVICYSSSKYFHPSVSSVFSGSDTAVEHDVTFYSKVYFKSLKT